MTRWFPWGSELDHPEPGDRIWAIGARDQERNGEAWTLVCPRCDGPMVGRSDAGGLSCQGCGAGYKDIPRREVAP